MDGTSSNEMKGRKIRAFEIYFGLLRESRLRDVFVYESYFRAELVFHIGPDRSSPHKSGMRE